LHDKDGFALLFSDLNDWGWGEVVSVALKTEDLNWHHLPCSMEDLENPNTHSEHITNIDRGAQSEVAGITQSDHLV
jgi:hypothetical protein